MAIGILVGTRPGIVKMAPLVHACEQLNEQCLVFHAGQHYSDNMDQMIRDAVGLRDPDYRAVVGTPGQTHATQTAAMLVGIEKGLIELEPSCLLVCGDANTNLAGAIAARKLNIAIGHVEAGLRSRDRRMPEEHNRIMIDHISDWLFAPTLTAADNLQMEGLSHRTHVTGNTIVDAVKSISQGWDSSSTQSADAPDHYILATSHRQENVDQPERLQLIVQCFRRVSAGLGLPILFPAHPRTLKRLSEFGLREELEGIPGIRVMEPKPYGEMLALIEKASVVLTDSGGIQEEACILGTPTVTIRETTERPETIACGANTLVGLDPEAALEAGNAAMSVPAEWTNPFGDGTAALQIIEIIRQSCS